MVDDWSHTIRTIGLCLLVWCVLSVPVALVVGRVLRRINGGIETMQDGR